MYIYFINILRKFSKKKTKNSYRVFTDNKFINFYSNLHNNDLLLKQFIYNNNNNYNNHFIRYINYVNSNKFTFKNVLSSTNKYLYRNKVLYSLCLYKGISNYYIM